MNPIHSPAEWALLILGLATAAGGTAWDIITEKKESETTHGNQPHPTTERL